MVDFSGYTPFWGTLFLHGPRAKRSIWLHNDLAADAHRSIAGNKPLKDGLFATFAIYRNFDNLVSVSEGLRDINESSLAKWAPSSSFAWASNTINPAKIRQLAVRNGVTQGISGKSPECKSDRLGKIVYDLLNPLTTDSEVLDTEDITTGDAIGASTNYFSFISVGRLSPEKNHARLIDAFAIVHQDHPLTRLVIVGEGPLRHELERKIVTLGLSRSIRLVGHTSNPYRLMANSDVFVLSSDYEGQPMVLLEALVLGLPVITTSFGSVAGALPPGVGTIVDPGTTELARAMSRSAISKTAQVIFDGEAYNQRAIAEFESIVI